VPIAHTLSPLDLKKRKKKRGHRNLGEVSCAARGAAQATGPERLGLRRRRQHPTPAPGPELLRGLRVARPGRGGLGAAEARRGGHRPRGAGGGAP